jgi:hypothetical protein
VGHDALELDTRELDALELDSMGTDTGEPDAMDHYAGPEVLYRNLLV